MKKGTSYERVLRIMKLREVRWPISRELAVRYHDVPRHALEKLERKRLIHPGELPEGACLPPPTDDPALDSFIRDLTVLGIHWPATRDQLVLYGGAKETIFHGLLRHGLILGPELYDGSLNRTQVRVLHELGITSREEFRRQMAEGGLKLRMLRSIGERAVELLIAWACGTEPPPVRRGLSLRVWPEAKAGLETLRLRHGLPTKDEMVEKLVADALRAAGPTREASA
ncbi:MAG: hypothetical protein ABI318_07045 [Chthoniobacteraceae bacterium]